MFRGVDPNDETEMAYLRSEQYIRDRQRDYEWDNNLPPYALEQLYEIDDACRFCHGVGCYYCTGDSGEWS